MPIVITAEIGINHNGNMSICKSLIDAAVDAGVAAASRIGKVYAYKVLARTAEGLEAVIIAGENVGATSFTHADFSSGIVWSYNNKDGHINVTDNHDLKFNAGFAVHHLSRPKYSYLGLNHRYNMRFVLHGDGLISIADTRYAWLPGFMFYYQGKAKEFLIGSLFRVKLQQDSKYTGYKNGSAISFGGYLRARDAFTPTILFEFHQFAIGCSYDINISGLNPATNSRGGLEISLRFTNKNPFMDGKIQPIGRVN